MPDREPIEPVVPEPIRIDDANYAEGHWDYSRRCGDVEQALTAARERVEEWDREVDPHGWWHERPDWIALHNEVLRLRGPALPDDIRELLTAISGGHVRRWKHAAGRATALLARYPQEAK